METQLVSLQPLARYICSDHTVTRHNLFSRLISRSERDLLSVDHDSSEDMHVMARHAVKKNTRATLPRGFGSTECINTSDQTMDIPDKVIKVFKADQTCKYFMVYKVRCKFWTCDRALFLRILSRQLKKIVFWRNWIWAPVTNGCCCKCSIIAWRYFCLCWLHVRT